MTSRKRNGLRNNDSARGCPSIGRVAVEKVVLNGRVVSGGEKAAFFTQLTWVQNQCHEKLGFFPYPGTLNLEIVKEDLHLVNALRTQSATELISPDQGYCTGKTFPVEIDEIHGALILPPEEVSIHGRNIVEVMAEVRLRDALGVDDGDRLTLIVRCPSEARISGSSSQT
jgi:CTP-dependent riboflavin kinase